MTSGNGLASAGPESHVREGAMLEHRTVAVLLCACMLAAGSLQAAGLRLQENDAYAQTGSFGVQTIDSLRIADGERGSEVLVRVWYPTGPGPFPVIAFSHSLNADKDIYSRVSRHWASHGYVVVHPQHDDSGVRMGPDGMQPPPEKIRNRLRDVVAVLDGLDQIESQVPDLQGKLDRSRLAVAGHSYGSFITMLAGGITVRLGEETSVNLGDPRVRCVLPISPSGRGDYGMSDGSWDSLTMPALFITGTRDQRDGRPDDWRMEPYELSAAGNKYLVVIEGAAHPDFGGDTESNAPNYVKAASAAFWDSCLNGTRQGYDYLADGFADFAAGSATISAR